MTAHPAWKHHCKLLFVLSLSLILLACGSSGPKPPQPGTPAFNWLAAKTAYKAGDYNKANDLLVRLATSENEFTAQAQPWALVMSLGLVNSSMKLADTLTEGAKSARSNTAPFRRLTNEYRAKATATGMQYAEIAQRFLKANKDKEVTLVFALPESNLEDPPQFKKILKGMLVPEAEFVGVEKEMNRREVLLSACRALGAPKDPAKAKLAYQNDEAKVEGQKFLLLVANGLYDISVMYGPKKLSQPNRVISVLYDEAQTALALVKDSKEAKELAKKISAEQKKIKEIS